MRGDNNYSSSGNPNRAISRGAEVTTNHRKVTILGYYFSSILSFSTFLFYLIGIWLFT
jgi:hypothetical protein